MVPSDRLNSRKCGSSMGSRKSSGNPERTRPKRSGSLENISIARSSSCLLYGTSTISPKSTRRLPLGIFLRDSNNSSISFFFKVPDFSSGKLSIRLSNNRFFNSSFHAESEAFGTKSPRKSGVGSSSLFKSVRKAANNVPRNVPSRRG